jgi:NAD(P)-dependent dehydrogenase (short-subunit alcohol dehydrogenase family)
VITLACDLTAVGAAASIAASACEAGQPVALVHTAGMSPAIADAKRIMAVNFEASRRLVETLFEIAGPGFSAVLIASMAPYIVAVDPAAAAQLFTPLDDNFWSRLLPFCPDGRATYALSKRGVISLCAREAPRWGARGARINSISPGIIDTPMARKEFELDGDAMQALVDLCPAGRKGNADEIASAAHFLCSDQAAFISGADLLVDGGVVAALHRASMA